MAPPKTKLTAEQRIAALEHGFAKLEKDQNDLKTFVDKKITKSDRNDVVGCIVINGRNTPARDKTTRESPLNIVMDLAWRMFRVEIKPEMVISCSRMSVHVTAPIFVRFASSHDNSVFYTLTDPSPKVQDICHKNGIYWNKFQTDRDKHYKMICVQLVKKSLIHTYLVNKNHMTVVIPSKRDQPIVIKEKNDLYAIFKGHAREADAVAIIDGKPAPVPEPVPEPQQPGAMEQGN